VQFYEDMSSKQSENETVIDLKTKEIEANKNLLIELTTTNQHLQKQNEIIIKDMASNNEKNETDLKKK